MICAYCNSTHCLQHSAVPLQAVGIAPTITTTIIALIMLLVCVVIFWSDWIKFYQGALSHPLSLLSPRSRTSLASPTLLDLIKIFCWTAFQRIWCQPPSNNHQLTPSSLKNLQFLLLEKLIQSTKDYHRIGKSLSCLLTVRSVVDCDCSFSLIF